MPRVIGIDPGTVSVDICGLDDGRLFLDRSLPTLDACSHASPIVDLLQEAHRASPVDLVAGPSGYGLPLTDASRVTDDEMRLAYLASAGESGGIGGLRSLMRELARLPMPIVLTPGVVHLASVPAHRKVNRVDMGTADKVCVTALAVQEQSRRRACAERDVSFILLEMGGAFTAALAVAGGQIVDGAGGSSGPLGARAAGALDGEVAFLAGSISKKMLFAGGAATIAGSPDAPPQALASPGSPRARLALEAFLESAVKAVVSLAVSAPAAHEVIVSGRYAYVPGIVDELTRRLRDAGAPPVRALAGFAQVAKQAAQGAALLADGLCGGTAAPLVKTLGIREASGTVLDHLYVISPAAARARLGIA